MTTAPTRSPVLFLVFNRPEQTRTVFDAIRRARPPRLYIAADGPRPGHPTDADRCAEVRDVVAVVDWPCEVRTLFRERNLGCGTAVSGAIDWFFEQEPEGIILEDDCRPHPSFFPFCDELLVRYRHDRKVMSIGGTEYSPPDRRPGAYSYRFSRHSLMWGWATWRRAWALNDHTMVRWPALRETRWLRDLGGSWQFARVWRDLLDDTYSGRIDTWDYQWIYSCWLQGGASIIPSVNLVQNLGFTESATHTPYPDDPRAGLPTQGIRFPLRHPPHDHRVPELDRYLDRHWFFVTTPHATRLVLRGLDARFLGGAVGRAGRTIDSFLRILDDRFFSGRIRELRDGVLRILGR